MTNLYGTQIHIEIIGLDDLETRSPDTKNTLIEILKDFKHSEFFSDDIHIEPVDGDRKVVVD